MKLFVCTCIDVDILGYFVDFGRVGGGSARRHDWTVVLDGVDLRAKDRLLQDLVATRRRAWLCLKVGTGAGCRRTWGPSDVLSISWGLSRVSLSVFVPSGSSFTLREDFTSPWNKNKNISLGWWFLLPVFHMTYFSLAFTTILVAFCFSKVTFSVSTFLCATATAWLDFGNLS